MPKAKEFTVTIEDKPGALGKLFQALAEKKSEYSRVPILRGGARESQPPDC